MSDKKDTTEKKEKDDTMEKIISLCKRRGFIYQGSEIYGGLAGTWDYGPLGVSLKRNIEKVWWDMFVDGREDVYGLDAAILMNSNIWRASGHVDTFSDPLVEDVKTKRRHRADHLLEEAGIDPAGMTPEEMGEKIIEAGIKSPDGNDLGEVQNFKLMFETKIGATDDETDTIYLRPETAGGIFVNFKNVMDSFHPNLPFGIAQIGKAFRNEIAPRDFIFRVRELEQMEIEYFVRPENWKDHFEHWREQVWNFSKAVGLPEEKVHELEVPEADRAHYSERTIDFEFDYPFGRKELYGLAYRTDYDLSKQSKGSGQNLHYVDPATGEKIIPHVIEPSLGVGRTLLAVLTSAYIEDNLGGEGETRAFLKLSPRVAPVKVAVFPLLKNKPELVAKAREVYEMVRSEIPQTMFDDNGNVGKRYRRQDEIGTPLCITVDFETLEGGEGEDGSIDVDTVTLRDRDTGEQERIAISELLNVIKERLDH
jgi:glycyl-tRNA synthetase